MVRMVSPHHGFKSTMLQGFTAWSLYVLPMLQGVKETPELLALRLIGDSKLYIGVNVSKKSCHSVLALQRVCNLSGVYPHHHTLTHHT